MAKNHKKDVNCWNKSGTFSSFSEADEERNILLNDETLQVKVRRRHASESYTVHFRKNPELAEKKVKKEKKEKKAKKERPARKKREQKKN